MTKLLFWDRLPAFLSSVVSSILADAASAEFFCKRIGIPSTEQSHEVDNTALLGVWDFRSTSSSVNVLKKGLISLLLLQFGPNDYFLQSRKSA